MIFVDSNLPMYLIGAAHPHKVDAQRLLESAVANRERLVTNVEVLQEILCRYVAVDRRDAIQPAFDVLLGAVDEVFPIELRDVERAKTIVFGSNVSARDAIHLASMQRRRITRIMSFDSGFDNFAGITRLH